MQKPMSAEGEARMNIGEAARASGVNAKMIRYYEQIGLVRPAQRTGSNYRTFDERNVNELRFIKRARTLGFTVEEIAGLLSLWRDQDRPDLEVRAIADARVSELEARIAEMCAMADTLRHLSESCLGDARPDAPILADLAGDAPPVAAKPSEGRFGCCG